MGILRAQYREMRDLIVGVLRSGLNLRYGVKQKIIPYSVPERISEEFASHSGCRTELGQLRLDKKNSRWAGCISLGNFIYMAPVDGAYILKLNTVDETIHYLESRWNGLQPDSRRSSLLYTGICRFQNSLYVMPRSANSLLKLNLRDETIDIIPLPTHYGREHHYSGAVTEDGILYQPPRNTNHILVTDLKDYSVKTIPIGTSKGYYLGRYRYSGVIRHPNGNIYMIPEFNERVIKLDPKNNSVSFIGSFLRESRVIGPTVGKDGNIYGFLMFNGGILKIDVNTDRVEILEQQVVTRCCGTECGVNGKLYGIPAYKNIWFQFDIDKGKIEQVGIPDKDADGAFEFAAGAGAGIGIDGSIYTVPCHGDSIYCMRFLDTVQQGNLPSYLENGF